MDTTATNRASSERIIGYDVLDPQGKKIGTIDNLWVDDAGGQPEFLGIKSGFLGTATYVVPAGQARFDETNQTVTVPYDTDRIKGAPPLSSSEDMTDSDEDAIYRYYGAQRGAAPVMGRAAMAGAATDRVAMDRAAMDRAAMDRTATDRAAADRTAGAVARTESNQVDTRPADMTDRSDIRVPVSEERLTVGKRSVEGGSVRLRKIVRTEHVSVPVDLQREEVQVERVAATDRTAAPGDAFTEKTIDVPVRREEAVAQKQAQVTGEVRVHKTVETERQNVEGDVRKEEVVMDRDGVRTDINRNAEQAATRDRTDRRQ